MADAYDEIVAREIVATRVYAAPRVKAWWGPRGFTNTFAEFGMEPGAGWKYLMHGPDGKDYPNEVKVVEVDEMIGGERIVIDHVSMPRSGLQRCFRMWARGRS